MWHPSMEDSGNRCVALGRVAHAHRGLASSARAWGKGDAQASGESPGPGNGTSVL